MTLTGRNTTKAEFLASWPATRRAFAAPVPVPSGPPVPATDPPAPSADDLVTAGLAKIKKDLADLMTAQASDPDSATDPDDATVLAELKQISSLIDQAVVDQAKDVKNDKPATPPPADAPAPTPAPAAAARKFAIDDAPPAPVAAPEGGGGPDDAAGGDIPADQLCTDTACNHMASMHGDTDFGENTGACTTPECPCQAFTMPDGTQPALDGDLIPAAPGDDDNPAETDPTTAAAFAPGDPPPNPNDDPSSGNGADPGNAGVPAGSDPTVGESNADNTALGAPFTIPCGIIEGAPTGDGRSVQPMSLVWETPPLPLMMLKTKAHDPNGFGMDDPSMWVGVIESVWRIPAPAGSGLPEGAQVIAARGHFLATDEGDDAATIVEGMGKAGVSADVYEATEITTGGELDEWGDVIGAEMQLTGGSIAAMTVCPVAAFSECFIVIGDGLENGVLMPPIAQATAISTDTAPAAPDTVVPLPGGNPSPDPTPATTTSIAASGRYPNVLDRCEPCAADAIGQLRPLAASAGPAMPPRSWFDDPKLTDYTTLTVTDDGRVFGHVAAWGVCHIGISGECIMAPHSLTGYSQFHQGKAFTAEGDILPVGHLTVGIGHADLALAMRPTMDHYDNAKATAASVRAGEDEFGIWVAGAVDPFATAEQIHHLRTHSLSGDWRPWGRGSEMCAALSVNVPGLPIPRAMAASGSLTIVSAGAAVIEAHRPKAPATPEPLSVYDRALKPLLDEAGTRARREMLAMRGVSS